MLVFVLLLLLLLAWSVVADRPLTLLPKENNNFFLTSITNKTGIFLVAEVAFPSTNCSTVTKAWNKLTNSKCIFKHYPVYYNGLNIEAGKSVDGSVAVSVMEGVSVDKFLANYPNILVKRQFNSTLQKFSIQNVVNFIESFKEKNQMYTLPVHNSRMFASDFSHHFFDVRLLSQNELFRRVSGAMAVLGLVGVFLV